MEYTIYLVLIDCLFFSCSSSLLISRGFKSRSKNMPLFYKQIGSPGNTTHTVCKMVIHRCIKQRHSYSLLRSCMTCNQIAPVFMKNPFFVDLALQCPTRDTPLRFLTYPLYIFFSFASFVNSLLYFPEKPYKPPCPDDSFKQKIRFLPLGHSSPL
jgi:hypothetical protein